MTSSDRTEPTTQSPVDPTRKTALVAGLLYLLTFVSIPTLGLLGPVKSDPTFILGTGSDTPILVSGFLEIIVALAGIGTALALFSVVKRQNESLALGLIATRIFEGAVIAIGVASLISLVSLHQSPFAGADSASLIAVGQAQIATHNSSFLIAQSLMPAMNALLLGTLLYRSRLVPRILPAVGLIGAPILIAATIATLFGYVEQYTPVAGLAALPIAAWELSLGLWLVFKGFRPAAVAGLAARSNEKSEKPTSAAPRVVVATEPAGA